MERVTALPDQDLDLPPLVPRNLLTPALGAAEGLLSLVHEDVHVAVDPLAAAEAALQELKAHEWPAAAVLLEVGSGGHHRRPPEDGQRRTLLSPRRGLYDQPEPDELAGGRHCWRPRLILIPGLSVADLEEAGRPRNHAARQQFLEMLARSLYVLDP